MPKTYCYRLGDGNEGNSPRFLITLSDADCPYSAIAALMSERYLPGSRTRRHVVKNTWVDGEPEYGILGTVFEGPEGEQAFGAAWVTAELEPATEDDHPRLPHYETLRDALDLSAWHQYRRATARKG